MQQTWHAHRCRSSLICEYPLRMRRFLIRYQPPPPRIATPRSVPITAPATAPPFDELDAGCAEHDVRLVVFTIVTLEFAVTFTAHPPMPTPLNVCWQLVHPAWHQSEPLYDPPDTWIDA